MGIYCKRNFSTSNDCAVRRNICDFCGYPLQNSYIEDNMDPKMCASSNFCNAFQITTFTELKICGKFPLYGIRKWLVIWNGFCNSVILTGAQSDANPTPIPPINLPVKISILNNDPSVNSVRMISNHPMV